MFTPSIPLTSPVRIPGTERTVTPPPPPYRHPPAPDDVPQLLIWDAESQLDAGDGAWGSHSGQLARQRQAQSPGVGDCVIPRAPPLHPSPPLERTSPPAPRRVIAVSAVNVTRCGDTAAHGVFDDDDDDDEGVAWFSSRRGTRRALLSSASSGGDHPTRCAAAAPADVDTDDSTPLSSDSEEWCGPPSDAAWSAAAKHDPAARQRRVGDSFCTFSNDSSATVPTPTAAAPPHRGIAPTISTAAMQTYGAACFGGSPVDCCRVRSVPATEVRLVNGRCDGSTDTAVDEADAWDRCIAGAASVTATTSPRHRHCVAKGSVSATSPVVVRDAGHALVRPQPPIDRDTRAWPSPPPVHRSLSQP